MVDKAINTTTTTVIITIVTGTKFRALHIMWVCIFLIDKTKKL